LRKLKLLLASAVNEVPMSSNLVRPSGQGKGRWRTLALHIEEVTPQGLVLSKIVSISRSGRKEPLFLFDVSPTISLPLWVGVLGGTYIYIYVGRF